MCLRFRKCDNSGSWNSSTEYSKIKDERIKITEKVISRPRTGFLHGFGWGGGDTESRSKKISQKAHPQSRDEK
jgi:hypothetical protein